jgi:c-di-GMP-related signal transduction protein
VLESLRLSDDMRDALVSRRGAYGELLSLAEALEQENPSRGELEGLLGLEQPSVDEAYLTARSWADAIRQ